MLKIHLMLCKQTYYKIFNFIAKHHVSKFNSFMSAKKKMRKNFSWHKAPIFANLKEKT